MRTPQEDVTIDQIARGVGKISWRLKFNSVIYAAALAASLVLILVSLHSIRGSNDANFALATDAYKEAVATNAKVDAATKQNLDYIKAMVATWDKLARENPKIKVPKAPVLRPPGAPAPSDKDTDRPDPVPKAEATPTPEVKTRTVIKWRKPTPTPKPWWHF
jgi:hypothetical protein